MKLALLILALTAIVSAGIIHANHHAAPNPNDVLRQVHFYPLNPLAYACTPPSTQNPKLKSTPPSFTSDTTAEPTNLSMSSILYMLPTQSTDADTPN